MNIHPYAKILGGATGIATLVALRHPFFAIFMAVLAMVLLDIGLKHFGSDRDS